MRPEGKTGATEAGAAEAEERTSAGATGLRCTTTVFGCTTKGTNKATIAGVTDAYVYDDVGHAVRWMPEALVTPSPSDDLSAAFRCGTPQLVPHPLPPIPLPLSPKPAFNNQQLPKMWRARSLGPDVSRHGARWQGRALYWR